MSSYQQCVQWLRGRMHVSWHIAWLSFGVLIGILASSRAGFGKMELQIAAAVLLMTVALTMPRRYVFICAFAAGAAVGMCRGGGQYQLLQAYQQYYGKQVVVTGRVTEDVSVGPHGDQRIRVGDVHIDNTALPGSLWVSTKDMQTILRGDIVVLSGTLSKGFGTIPASMYQAQIQHVFYPPHADIGREVRDYFNTGVQRGLSPNDTELASAFLVGQKLAHEPLLNDQLKTIGLIHAVVASGAHLTILVAAARRMFMRTSKYLTAAASLTIVAGFILITGFSPSMTRAGLVSAVGLLAWYYGRTIHPVVLLLFVAAATALYDPSYVWGDAGWYLSFSAFVGVVILAPLLHHYFWGKDVRPGVLREVFVATVAAQITTLPVVMLVFGYYSPYALLSNVLIVPFIPLIMLLTFICGVIGLVLPAMVAVAVSPLQWLLDCLRQVIGYLAAAPGAKQEVVISGWFVLLGYMIIAAIILYLWRVTGHNFRRDTAVQKDF